MTILGLCLAIPAFLATLVGAIMMIVAAFRTSLAWGLIVLFVPLGALVFLILHWQNAKKGFFVNLAGSAAFVLAFFMIGAGAAAGMKNRISEASDLASSTRAERQGRGPEQPAAGPESGSLNTEDAQTGSPKSGEAEQPTSPAPVEPPPAPVQLPSPVAWTDPEPASWSASTPGGIQLKGLTRFVGQELIFVLKDGVPIRGKLLAAESDSVSIERYLPSGLARFTLTRSELQEIRLLG